MLASGDLNRLPAGAKEKLNSCIEQTADNNRLTLVLALSYSAKWEITDAVKQIAREVAEGKLNIDDIEESTISEHLTTKNIPDPDLMIRTSGEKRISNFLLWQLAYSEFYFTETHWPDFRQESLHEAIVDYQKRERRYGK